MSEISIVCPDCADQAGRLCDKIERLQSQIAEARKALEPLVTQLREATVYCTQMQSLESQCLAVVQELELLARDLSE